MWVRQKKKKKKKSSAARLEKTGKRGSAGAFAQEPMRRRTSYGRAETTKKVFPGRASEGKWRAPVRDEKSYFEAHWGKLGGAYRPKAERRTEVTAL